MRAVAALVAVAVVPVGSACSAVSAGNLSTTAPTTTTPTTTAPTTTTTTAPDVTVAPFAPPPEVFVVGDSLTVGAEPWLATAVAARGWRLTGVDARVGRPVPEGLNVLRRRARSLPATVVVALGTNNLGASDEDIDRWVATARRFVGEERRLVWVNLALRDDGSGRQARYEAINAALARAGQRWRVDVLDWDRWVDRNGVTTKADGIHYEDGAYRLRALFYAAALPRVSA